MTGEIVVSQLGARMHYAVPRILAAAERLAHFFTDVYATPRLASLLGQMPGFAAPPALRRLAHRTPNGVPPELITSFPLFGLRSAAMRLRNRNDTDTTRHAIWAGARFSRLVAGAGFASASGLYAFAGDALEQLEAAKRAGLWIALEQMNAPREHLDRMVADVQRRFPDWQAPPGANPYAAAFAARERAEWALADVILCPSEFVRQGLADVGGPVAKCVVVPYGVDASFAESERMLAPGPLRVLTVGQIGLRKGSPYVQAAAERLRGAATFRIVGSLDVPGTILAALRKDVEITGPVPRGEIGAQYAWADVFLLPSVCEGSATVVYEALAAGLPVIVTDNAGSVARDGEEGFIVPLGDVDAIVSAIEKLISDTRLRCEMAANARNRAREFRIESYGARLLAALPPREPARRGAAPAVRIVAA